MFTSQANKAAVIVILVALATSTAWGQPAVASSAEDVEPLQAGDSVPEVTVRTLEGAEVNLRQLTAGQPTVVVFYRGGWCPYCTTHLRELKDAMEGLSELGYQVLAVSPDAPEKLLATKTVDKLPYVLLSDSTMDAATAFGIAFRLDSETRAKYQEYGIDLDTSDWALPVPSVFLTRADGTITYVHADPDYTKRLSSAAVLDAARQSHRGSSTEATPQD